MRRAVLLLVSVVVAPVAGLSAAATQPNPPGSGPGAGQVLAGVLAPVLLVALAAGLTRTRVAFAGLWAILAVASTGVLFLVLVWATFAVTGGQ